MKDDEIPDSVAEVIRPITKLSVSEWADKYRFLPAGYPTPEIGQWRTSRVPYLRRIMDVFMQPKIEKIVLCKGSQIGGTEAEYNMICYAISEDPDPMLIVYPTEDLAKVASKNRLRPSFESCEPIRNSKTKEQDDFNIMEMQFKRMTLSLVGSNSPAKLASRPIRYVIIDEVDKFPPYVGKEADPISLALERQKTFYNRKAVIISTPTLETGYIWQSFLSCDWQMDYWVPCPYCQQYQVLKFQNIVWSEFISEEEKDNPNYFNLVNQRAVYKCEFCGAFIQNHDRPRMLEHGEWKPRNQEIETPRSIGFHLPSFYSAFLTWGDMAEVFLRSKDFPDTYQNVVNSWWAQPWIKKILYKEEHEYFSHKIDLPRLIVPDDTVALTAGVDPGQGGFWFVILAWNQFESVHLVDYGFLTSWENVETFLVRGRDPQSGQPFYRSVSGQPWYVFRTGVDTGGSEYDDAETTMTEDAYNFLKKFGKNINLIGTKGRGEFPSAQKMREAPDNIRIGNVVKMREFSLWLIYSGGFKDLLHYKLQIKKGERGYLTLNRDVKEDFVKHLMAEEKRRNKKGIYEWTQIARDNHFLDCMVIALACGDAECWTGIRGFRPKEGASPAPQTPPQTEKKTLDDFFNKKPEKIPGGFVPRTGWFGR